MPKPSSDECESDMIVGGYGFGAAGMAAGFYGGGVLGMAGVLTYLTDGFRTNGEVK